MILKWEDFKYPTEEEVLAILKEIPTLSDFGFKIKNPTDIFFINKSTRNQDILRSDHLRWWNFCLGNRFGRLRQTFEYVLVHFNRGISIDFNTDSPQIMLNSILFDYYAEIFYYLYFSSLDIIAQILNLYFMLGIDEKKVDFVKILSSDITIKSTLIEMNESIKDTRDCRNAFTHRFTPTLNDPRIILIKDGNMEALGMGSGKRFELDFILENIKESTQILADLMNCLKEYVEKDTDNNYYLFE